jgi:hypothetical protein
MTMTPTNQTPSECKHYNGGKCDDGSHVIDINRRCILSVWCLGANCSDYQPKEKKDGEE